MANPNHLRILYSGTKEWNRWRSENPTIRPHLVGANLAGTDLSGANLSRAWLSNAWLKAAILNDALLNGSDLRDANLDGAHLNRAILRWADLRSASLQGANLSDADFRDVNCSNAILKRATLSGADLTGAVLNETDLSSTDLRGAALVRASLNSADLTGTDVSDVQFGWTSLGDNDLSLVKGLNRTIHVGPSTVGVNTLYKSSGKIPEKFLNECGLSENLITFIPSLITSERSIEFYSCFISYSHSNEKFVQKLYSRMQESHLKVWFAAEDMRGGEKIYEQVDTAIRMHDRVLLVLSNESLQSEWVKTEIRKARKSELKENKRKLFPIRLVDMSLIKDWECFDTDLGLDLAVEVREYFIPDFSSWENDAEFEQSFTRLLHDLRSDALRKHARSGIPFQPRPR